MKMLLINVFAKHGGDHLLVDWQPGPFEIHRCSIVAEGTGSAEVAILEKMGRRLIATRPDSWHDWAPVAAQLRRDRRCSG